MHVSKRIIRLGWVLLSALLVVFCGASVVQAVAAFTGGDALGEIKTPAGPERPVQHGATMYAALENSPIFIQAAEPTPTPPVNGGDKDDGDVPPITDLDLVLVGVVRNADGSGVAVILNKRSRTQDTYAVGEEVLPNVSVTRIGATHVVLNNKGRTEALEMLLEGEGDSSGPSRSVVERRPPVNRQEPGDENSAAIRRINDNLRVISRESFEREYGANAANIITSTATETRFVGDQPSGLILRDLGRGNLMSDLGFLRDDVIVAVQGRRTNEPADLEAIGEFLSSASDVRVQIVRDNLPRTLIFKVR